eukprot:m.45801 g.45801  ORF g.45801 m.45801 type:complete len:67 (+) comp10296_c0_seq2:972-1172(+)
MFIYQRQLYLENCDYLCVRAMYSVPLVAFHQWLVPFHVRNLKICFCAPVPCIVLHEEYENYSCHYG